MRQRMQQRVLCSALCLALCGGSARAGRALTLDETLQQKVGLSTEPGAPDDLLLDVARKAKVNVVADATQWKDIDAAKPIDWEGYKQSGKLVSYLLELSDGRSLTWTHPDASTFLFWKQPEMAPLITRFLAGEEMDVPAAPMAPKEWQEMWLKYLSDAAKTHPPTAAAARPQGDLGQPLAMLQVKDLPLPLRGQVTSIIQQHVVTSPALFYDKRTLSAPFWSTAAVGFRPLGDPRRPVERLVLLNHDRAANSFSTIDPWVVSAK